MCDALVIDNVLQWQGLKVDLAVPVGREVSGLVNAKFQKTIRLLIYQQQAPKSADLENFP